MPQYQLWQKPQEIVTKTSYKVYNTDFPYFLTSTIVDWIPVFTNETYLELLFRNFVFYQKEYEIEILSYVIMHEHFHMICKCNKLQRAVQSLKSYSAKEILKQLSLHKNKAVLDAFRINKLRHKTESEYQVWQEGYHPKEMSNDLILRQKIEYIHNNPVKRGYVSKPQDWKYSSAGFYLDGKQTDLIITRYC